jgi:hypothetical protein
MLLIHIHLYGQITIIDSLTFQQSQDIEHASFITNGTTINKYISKDGSVLKVGDALKLGKPSTGRGDFSYVTFGKYNIGKAVMLGAPNLLNGAYYHGEEVSITEIFVYHSKMSKKSPLGIWVYVENPNKNGKNRTIMDYERAIEIGEVINPNASMTREQAISKLKESKDLLDLGIITQDKYDSIKLKMTPLITGTN